MLQVNKEQHDEAVRLALQTMYTMEEASRARGASWEDNARAASIVAELAKVLEYNPEMDGN